jgi:hypothetical protein
VAALEPWFPPLSTWTSDQEEKLLAAIEMGFNDEPLSPQLRDTPRSVKTAMDIAGISGKGAQAKLLAKIMREGSVQLIKFRNSSRREAKGLQVNGKPHVRFLRD